MAQTIGIDFGTAFVTACDWDTRASHPVTLTRIPAFARMLHGGGALCGEPAFAARSAYAFSTIDQIKRVLGRTRAEINGLLKHVAWTIQPDPCERDGFEIDAWTGFFKPQAVAAEILKTVKAQAERALDEAVGAAVLTVPAAATNRQRMALKDAAQRAGLYVKRIINEPAAIAIAETQLRPPAAQAELWAIVNFGAGMTDAAIVEIQRGSVAVRAAAGDTTLGLANLRERLVARLEARFRRRYGTGFNLERPEIRAELLWIGEEIIQALCVRAAQRVDLKSAGVGSRGRPLDLDEVLKQDDLNGAARPALRRLRELTAQALQRAGIPKSGLRRVLLAGGGAFVPAIQHATAEIFGRPLSTPHGAGIHLAAAGAALLAASLDGRAELSLRDVLAQGLGITLVNDRFSTLLPAGNPLPAQKTGNYTTVEDFQPTIRFEVREGDDVCASRNKPLGAFLLNGIRPARAGEPVIRVTFDIDESGILHVRAHDVITGAHQEVLIERTAS